MLLVIDSVFLTYWSGIAALLGSLLLLEPVVFGGHKRGAPLQHLRLFSSAVATMSRIERVLLVLFGIFFVLRLSLLLHSVDYSTPPPEKALLTVTRAYNLILALLGVAVELIDYQRRSLGRLALFIVSRPGLLLVASFAVLITLATGLLMLPAAVVRLEHISFIDALFTATSAVCVTGLSVNEIAQTYTTFGQCVVLVAVQLGGIGMMTVAGLALTFGRGSISVRRELSAATESKHFADLRSMVRTVVIYTLTFELLGALLLWLHWYDEPWLRGRDPLWLAAFHAVMAFCNAGFALFKGGLTQFQGDAYTQLILMVLICTGGIGFAIVRELASRVYQRWMARVRKKPVRWRRMSVGSRVVLWMTLSLVLVGALGFLATEYTGVLKQLDLWDSVVNAFFASVSTRSGGFNTLDLSSLAPATILLMSLLMFIGGASGSAAGGVKVTTLAVLFATLRAELRGREPELFGRRVDARSVRRALCVVFLTGGLVLLTLFFLLILEPGRPYEVLLFEVLSAVATVGLSLGLTPELSQEAKVVLIIAMFIGRIGPLTIAMAVGDRENLRYQLASEEIPVG